MYADIISALIRLCRICHVCYVVRLAIFRVSAGNRATAPAVCGASASGQTVYLPCLVSTSFKGNAVAMTPSSCSKVSRAARSVLCFTVNVSQAACKSIYFTNCSDIWYMTGDKTGCCQTWNGSNLIYSYILSGSISERREPFSLFMVGKKWSAWGKKTPRAIKPRRLPVPVIFRFSLEFPIVCGYNRCIWCMYASEIWPACT